MIEAWTSPSTRFRSSARTGCRSPRTTCTLTSSSSRSDLLSRVGKCIWISGMRWLWTVKRSTCTTVMRSSRTWTVGLMWPMLGRGLDISLFSCHAAGRIFLDLGPTSTRLFGCWFNFIVRSAKPSFGTSVPPQMCVLESSSGLCSQVVPSPTTLAIIASLPRPCFLTHNGGTPVCVLSVACNIGWSITFRLTVNASL